MHSLLLALFLAGFALKGRFAFWFIKYVTFGSVSFRLGKHAESELLKINFSAPSGLCTNSITKEYFERVHWRALTYWRSPLRSVDMQHAEREWLPERYNHKGLFTRLVK